MGSGPRFEHYHPAASCSSGTRRRFAITPPQRPSPVFLWFAFLPATSMQRCPDVVTFQADVLPGVPHTPPTHHHLPHTPRCTTVSFCSQHPPYLPGGEPCDSTQRRLTPRALRDVTTPIPHHHYRFPFPDGPRPTVSITGCVCPPMPNTALAVPPACYRTPWLRYRDATCGWVEDGRSLAGGRTPHHSKRHVRVLG